MLVGSHEPRPSDNEPPSEYVCPITHEVMYDPVLLVDTGHTYERWAITKWFRKGKRTCPKSGRRVNRPQLVTNWNLKSLIASWAEAHGAPLTCREHELSLPGLEDHAGNPSAVSQNNPCPVGSPLLVPGWTFFQGLDSPSGDRHRCTSRDDVVAIAAEAEGIPGVVAFNTNGYIKKKLTPQNSWSRWTNNPCRGMYVRTFVLSALLRDVPHMPAPTPSVRGWTFLQGWDPPGGDIRCSPHQDIYALVAESELTPGCVAFTTKGCLKKSLAPTGQWTRLNPDSRHGVYVQNDILPELVGALETRAERPTKIYGWTFFQGLDSHGGDLRQSSCSGADLPALALQADSTAGCVAFNTNGWLKGFLRGISDWCRWSLHPRQGLYVRDDALLGLMCNLLMKN